MFFFVIGLVVIITSVIWGVSNWQFMASAETAQGIVTNLNAGSSHPEIKFTTKEGKEIEYAQGGLIFGYRVGDEVSVYYDSQNPKNAVIKSFGALWGFPVLAFLLAVCFVCAGLFWEAGN